MQPEDTIQGALQVMYELQQDLAEISGMSAVSLQPVAGAHGEFTGVNIIYNYHKNKGQHRTKIIMPIPHMALIQLRPHYMAWK